MIIDLPEKFRFQGDTPKDYAEVRENTLHIYGNVPIRKLMYDLTYSLKGNTECFYCQRKIKKSEITLDHMYPQDIGGPTIPNNLTPACKECNSKKANMTVTQYKTYLTLNKNKKAGYRKLIKEQQQIIRRGGGYEVPLEWIDVEKVSKFIVKVEMGIKYRGKKYDQIKADYREYKTITKPIVTDANGFVIDGFITLMFAKEQGIKRLAVLKLENVIVHL